MIRRITLEDLALTQRFPCVVQQAPDRLSDLHRTVICLIQTIQTGDIDSLSVQDIQTLANQYIFTRLSNLDNAYQLSEDVIAIVSNWYQKYHVASSAIDNFPLKVDVPTWTGDLWTVATSLPLVTPWHELSVITFADSDISQVDLYNHPWYRWTIYCLHKITGRFPVVQRLQIRSKSVDAKLLNVGNQRKYLLDSENMLRLALTSLEKKVTYCNQGCTGVDTQCSRFLTAKEKLSLY